MRRTLSLALLLVALVLLSRPLPARGANFVVTNTSDCATTGCGSLRDAINQSNAAAPGPNVITFSGAGTSGTISTSISFPAVLTNLTITGPGSSLLALDFPRPFGSGGSLGTSANINLAISGLSVRGELSTCIKHLGTGGSLTLTDVVLQGCGNGGLRSSVATTLTDVTITGNGSPTLGAAAGGGLVLDGAGTSVLNRVTVSNNRNGSISPGANGGGLVVANGSVTVMSSTISDNATASSNAFGFVNNTGLGGGIYQQSGSLTISNSTIASNSVSGGIFGVSSPDIRSRGGGIFVASGTLTITGSTLSGNTAVHGGGALYVQGGSVTLTNVTVSGNSTDNGNGVDSSNGGGLAVGPGATLTATNVTIANNSAKTAMGGNLWSASAANTTLTNTLIANAISGGDCAGAFTSAGHNLASDHSCDASLNFGNGDYAGLNPQLGPLANNGGSTLTHLPANTSPAINRGANTGCPATDQRGIARPQNNVCDIGAVEVQLANATAPSFTSAGSATFTTGQPGSFLVTTAGIPTPAITRAGALPEGLIFVDNGNSTATISGTPAVNTLGTYALTLTASTGILPNASQSFTLTVIACGLTKGCISVPALPNPPSPPAPPPFVPPPTKGLPKS
jgi:hypothetical protein